MIFRNKNLKYYSLIGKTDINQLLYIIENAKFVIGNDTSAIHIAASYNVPTLAISSAVSGNRFYPYVVDSEEKRIVDFIRKDVECKKCSFSHDGFLNCIGLTGIYTKKKKCISDISSLDLISEADKFLDKIKGEQKL